MVETLPSPVVTQCVLEEPKAAKLDGDRTIPLTHEVATIFAADMNRQLQTPRATGFFTPERANQFTQIINAASSFPFTAHMEGDTIRLSPTLEKTRHVPVLKDLSDGITTINHEFTAKTQIGEMQKFELAMLSQAPLRNAYCAAGMSEGPHTKYIYRSC